MYQIKFKNPVEIRMGSPFNIADVELEGEFVPSLDRFDFQDKGAVNIDGTVCYLVEWKTMHGNKPGFCVWQISEREHSTKKSEMIEGCCEDIISIDFGVMLSIFREDRKQTLVLTDFKSI